MFKILSIDGGGIKGIFPAHILKRIQECFDINLLEHFDMIAGTSTGSIIAAGIACKKTPDQVVELYQQYGAKIFSQKKKSFWPYVFKSTYENTYLKTMLSEEFGTITLGDIKKPLIIPTTDVGHGGVHVFKSAYSPDFIRDGKVFIKDAVLASCSAPTFFDPTTVGNYLLADGGLWANNPALVAVIEAKHRLRIDAKEIRILSLGTGESRNAYGMKESKKWGFVTGWKGREFVELILSLQSQSTQNYTKLMLGDKLLRLNFETDKPFPLDDVSIFDDLISRADRVFSEKSKKIEKFLNNSG